MVRSASKLWVLNAVVLVACTGSIDAAGSDRTPSGPGTDGSGRSVPGTPGAGTAGDPGSADPNAPATGQDPPARSAACAELVPGAAPMRRLSNFEYRNTISDLFDDSALADQVTSAFTSETESLGFRNGAKFLQVNTVTAQQFMDAAEEIAARVQADPESVLPCTPASPGEERACASDFIAAFGKKLYRRPLSSDEVASYEALYDTAREDYAFDVGIEWVTFALLQSPHFLNRVEFAPEPASGETYARPTSYEMASRLSYLLWQSMPDDALFTAAEQDALRTDAQVAVQARRMLADPKAKRVYQFFEQWLDIDELPAMSRDSDVYPDFEDALPGLLADEARAFVDHVLWEEDGSFDTLMTAPYSFLNEDLASHYGISGVSGDDLQQVDTPGRAGILTLGGVVSVHDKATRSSIVLRGLRVRTELLCQVVGAPPPDIVVDLPEVEPGLPQSTRLEQHRTQPLCASCHTMMDPLGVPFESFDAIGRLRSEDEQGNPIETAGAITGTAAPDVDVADAIELSARLAESKEVRDCFAKQAFRFFYGRGETADDSCSVDQLITAFEQSNYSIQELLVALTQTDAFLYRPTLLPGGVDP